MVGALTQPIEYLQECASDCLREFIEYGSQILQPHLADFVQVGEEEEGVFISQ